MTMMLALLSVVTIQSSTTVFVLGLVIGTTLLLLGLGLGVWLGRKMSPSYVLEDSMEREQVMRFVRNFATWTNDFAGDFSRYQTQVKSITAQVAENPEKFSANDLSQLLKKLTEANQQLQCRLESTEEKLENQTKELASYLTEARTDGLTGLANRRAFDQKMDERFARWNTHKKSFCLALIDIDFFKKVNDTYGHPAGDSVLTQLASQLRLFATNGIEVARYGGEEFAVLLDTSLEASTKLLDQFREQVRSMRVVADGVEIPISISVGLSTILPEERIGMFVRRADEALYAAKSGGRNRVYFHDGKLCRPFGNPVARQTFIEQPTVADISPPSAEVSKTLQQRLQERLERIVEEETAAERAR